MTRQSPLTSNDRRTGASGTGSTLYVIYLTIGSLLPIGNVSGASPLRGIAIAP